MPRSRPSKVVDLDGSRIVNEVSDKRNDEIPNGDVSIFSTAQQTAKSAVSGPVVRGHAYVAGEESSIGE